MAGGKARRRVGRRIFGIETEFGLAWRGAPEVDVDEVGRALFEPLTAEDESTEEFLPNGARAYLDMGTHPEYATGECDDLVQLVTHDKAGERVLDSLAVRAEHRLADGGSPGQIYLFKNNTDFSGNGYGSHENYLVSRRVSLERLAAVLVPFLVSRQLVCGAGAVRKTRRGARYCLSQRAPYIGEDVSDATTQERPIVNTRDEPHADPRRYRRLHLIVGDSTMSELTTFLKIGATHLVLDMTEGGTAVPELRLADPVAAIRAISRDTTGMRPVKLADGRSMSALDIQRTYHDRAARHLARRGEEPDLTRVLELWGSVLDALARRDPSAIDRQVDWAIKRRLVEHYRARHDLPLDSPRVARLDLAYHDIRPGRGLFDLLQRAGLAERVADDAAIAEAVERAPQTTRARLRGEFVSAARRAHREVSVDWSHLAVDDSGRPPLTCRDPFRTADPRVEKLIATLDRA